MDFKLKYSLFPTESIYAMRQFISEVLDTEIVEEEGLYYFTLGGSLFLLTEIRPLSLVKEIPHFELEIPSQKAFLALKDKVDFFYFRQNKKFLNSDSYPKSHFEGNSLKVFDPDGRLWNFILSKGSELINRGQPSASTAIN